MQLVPLLLQVMVKLVLVLPLPGLIEAEQVGRAGGWVTETLLELHCVVPPGPVARRVTVWLPTVKRLLGRSRSRGRRPD
ncbi:MAG: hypothetical protein IPG96_13060 [Proteobacteria bacterium]|nr:hypothetical protein [Pseudomonadota bacterium]